MSAAHHATGSRASRVAGATQVDVAAATAAARVCLPSADGHHPAERGRAKRVTNLCGRPEAIASRKCLPLKSTPNRRAKVGLTGGAWITNTSPQTISGNNVVVTVMPTNSRMFYRLKSGQ